jgi:hypothetical protein
MSWTKGYGLPMNSDTQPYSKTFKFETDDRIYWSEYSPWYGMFCRQIYDKINDQFIDTSDGKDFDLIAEQDSNLTNIGHNDYLWRVMK